jgi:MGT family glycosyltransferase
LVVVSLGTTDMGEGIVLQRVLDALSTLPVDVLATVGTHVDRDALRVPPNATVTGYVRHAAVLPHADVFVGHGGHGGIMAAFAFGVPVVSVPLDRDQPQNAARVEAVGAGRTVAKDATTADIRDVIESVRTGMREREGAIRMANAIAGYGHAPVEAIESLAGSR